MFSHTILDRKPEGGNLSMSVNDWLKDVTLKDYNTDRVERVTIPGDVLADLHAKIGQVLEARAIRQRNLEQIASLTPDQVVRSYSGKPGCACGCRGNYSTRPATIKLVLARLQDNAPRERNRDLLVGTNSQGGMYFSVDTETDRGTPRTYTVYVGPGWDD